uniref:Uncharacterized protein n=1 Tax=Setaria italica TaxID=4555 RepID=K4A478_SETIT
MEVSAIKMYLLLEGEFLCIDDIIAKPFQHILMWYQSVNYSLSNL